jgi:hypothetical protein
VRAREALKIPLVSISCAAAISGGDQRRQEHLAERISDFW